MKTEMNPIIAGVILAVVVIVMGVIGYMFINRKQGPAQINGSKATTAFPGAKLSVGH